jgi:hypothetical protein
MIRHIWSVLCQSASFDIQTNNVSLQNVLESIIVVGELDASHPIFVQAEIVSLWARENINLSAVGKMRAHFIQPDGKKAPEINLDINLTQGIFHRTRINITPGLVLVEKGEHIFHIEYQIKGDDNWLLAAKIPLIVVNQ